MAGGRPTVYKPENPAIAQYTCMLGATNETLAERFEVSRRTIDNWIATIPEFRDAVREGREGADASVALALFARATGTERKMTKVFCHNGQPVTVDYTAYLPPDVRACIFWLRNRRPDLWRENRPMPRERDDGWWERAMEEGAEEGRLRALAKRAAASPVPSEAEGNASEANVRSAAERLRIHA